MAPVRQTSFAAGELSPLLWGRTDMELHGHGLRTCRNFIITRQGAAVSRGGTVFKRLTKGEGAVRLVPFIYSDAVSHILEFGHWYVRIHAADFSSYVELSTPYQDTQIGALQFAQVGAILHITHPDVAMQELRAPVLELSGSTSWTLVEARYSPPGDSVTDTQSLVPVFEDAGGNLKLPPMLVQFRRDSGDKWKDVAAADSLFVTDAEHPPREWRYKVSALLRHKTTGAEVETVPVPVTHWFDGYTQASETALPTDGLIVCYPDSPVLLRFPEYGPTIGSLFRHANWDCIGAVFYKGRGKLYGYIGDTRYAQDFVDAGIAPNYAQQPLRGEPPNIGNPTSVAFFQQRRAIARGQRVCLSATDDWGNHDAPIPPFIPDDAAIEFDVYAHQREAVRALVSMNRLVVLTDTSIRSVGGTESALTPSSIGVKLEDAVGAEAVTPALVDGTLVYVRAKGRGLRALGANPDDNGSLRGRDITWQAAHLFTGGERNASLTRKVTSLAYAEDPWGALWALREDGVLLSATRSGDTWGWARHDTGADDYRHDRVVSLCVVPEGTEDGVYLVVERGTQLCIERMDSRSQAREDVEQFCCVDSCYRYEGAPATQFVGILPHLAGRTVYLTGADNRPQAGVVESDGSVTFDELPTANAIDPATGRIDVLVAYIGLPFTAELELLDISGRGTTTQKNVTEVGLEVDASVGVQVGPDFEHLTPWRQRTGAAGYGFPSAASELVVVKVGGGWNRGGRAALRQALPLPVTVLGVTREVDRGEGS